jgi:hypothetical protein
MHTGTVPGRLLRGAQPTPCHGQLMRKGRLVSGAVSGSQAQSYRAGMRLAGARMLSAGSVRYPIVCLEALSSPRTSPGTSLTPSLSGRL